VTVGVARVMILAAALLCGTNFAGVKLLQDTLDPSTFMSVRFLLAGVALLPIVNDIRAYEGDRKGLVNESVLTGTLLGLGYVAQSLALKQTDAGTTAFLCSLTTVVCPIIEKVTHPTPPQPAGQTGRTSLPRPAQPERGAASPVRGGADTRARAPRRLWGCA
jgi:hypothetical protein